VTTVSVIIPAFNEEAFLPRTLEFLARARNGADFDLEIIVVDNGSTDATARVARQGGARVIDEPVRQIARARNAGAAAARGSILLFVDADTLVESATLHQAVSALRSGTVCGGGARLRGDREWRGFAVFLVWLWDWISRVHQLPAGSFVYCTREAFLGAGGFEERVYAGEEVWFARRLKAWGRQRGQAFRLLEDPPVITSVRKGEIYGSWQLLAQFLLLMTCPWVAMSRRLCWVWYRR